MRDIDRDQVNALISKLQRQGLAASTISRYVGPVRACLADAVDAGHLRANPATRLRINAKAQRKPRESERVKAMTRAELAAVLAQIPDRWRLVFEVMAGSGCRISEALGLEWSDLEQSDDHTLLHIERQWYRGKLKATKTDAGKRRVELAPGLGRKLWQLGADGTGPMFCSRSGHRLIDRNLARVLAAASKRAGVPGVSHHSFRHTHGSILLDEGWTIPEVSERLGHANPAITAAVYSHALRDRCRELGFLDLLDNGMDNALVTEYAETHASGGSAVSPKLG